MITTWQPELLSTLRAFGTRLLLTISPAGRQCRNCPRVRAKRKVLRSWPQRLQATPDPESCQASLTFLHRPWTLPSPVTICHRCQSVSPPGGEATGSLVARLPRHAHLVSPLDARPFTAGSFGHPYATALHHSVRCIRLARSGPPLVVPSTRIRQRMRDVSSHATLPRQLRQVRYRAVLCLPP